MQLRSGVLAILVAAAFMAGCASTGGFGPNARYADAEEGGYGSRNMVRHVLVQNHSWNRVTIYITNDAGAQVRLGDVESMDHGAFPVSQITDDGASMHFVARPLAGQLFRSEGFLFPLGTTAIWTIENHTALSSVKVR